jgi:hypothetical protein
MHAKCSCSCRPHACPHLAPAPPAAFPAAILSFSEAYDFKPEADRTATALESAEEDLKDLKKANHQDEEHLREAIQLIEQYQDQQAQVLTRLDRKLDAAAKEFAALGATKAAPLTPLPSAINEVRED